VEYRAGMRSEERRVKKTAMGRKERVQTVDNRFPALSQAPLSPETTATEPAYTATASAATQPPTKSWHSGIAS